MGYFDTWNFFMSSAMDGDADAFSRCLTTLVKEQKLFSVNVVDEKGRTALSYAAENGHVDIVRALLGTEGIDCEAADSYGRTALWYAAKKGCTDVVDALVDAGADVNTHDRDFITPLHWAAINEDTDGIKKYFSKGAKLDVQNVKNLATPLHYAVAQNRPVAVGCLLELGARADIPNSFGYTAIDVAKQMANQAVLLELLKLQARPSNDAAAPQLVITTTQDSENWYLLGTNKLSHVETFSALNRSITEIFNFESRERWTITQNLETKAETLNEPVSFDELSSSALLNAFKKFVDLGGEADSATVFTPDRLKELSRDKAKENQKKQPPAIDPLSLQVFTDLGERIARASVIADEKKSPPTNNP